MALRGGFLVILTLLSTTLLGAELLATDNRMPMGRFLALRASDCQTVFYVPLQYRIRPELSSVLAFPKNGRTMLAIDLDLAPKAYVPNDAEDQAMRSWAKNAAPACAVGELHLRPYPSLLQDFSVGQLSEAAFETVDTNGQANGEEIVHLVVDPRLISATSLVKILNFLRLQKRISYLDTVRDAWVTIDGNYSDAAEFFTAHFAERRCVTVSHYDIINGRKIREDCSYTPVEVQVLKNASTTQNLIMESSLAEGVPIETVIKLQIQAMSRLALSLYVHDQERALGDVTTIVLGRINRSLQGRYHDMVSIDHVTEDFYQTTLSLPRMGDFAEGDLRRLYTQLKSAQGEEPNEN